MNIKRGELYYADLSPVIGSEQGGVRPVLIVQNDTGNQFSPTTIVAPITSKDKHRIPTHVDVKRSTENGLSHDSTLLMEQIRLIDKCRIKKRIGYLNSNDLNNAEIALKISLEIN